MSTPIKDLRRHPKNAKKHPKSQIKKLAEYIKKTGWRVPIIVSKRSGFIVSGHGKLEAAKELGMEEVPVVFQEFSSEKEEIQFLLADNRLAELGQMDGDALSEVISELGSGADIELIGFDPADFAQVKPVKIQGKEEFSQEIGEANNYVVLVFKTDIDWTAALTHFELKPVSSRRRNGEAWFKGVGRVIDGGEYLKSITGSEED